MNEWHHGGSHAPAISLGKEARRFVVEHHDQRRIRLPAWLEVIDELL